jgi:ArsR family transcriptional regulator
VQSGVQIDVCQCITSNFFDTLPGMADVHTLPLVDDGERICCQPIGDELLDEADAGVLARAFAALADPVRLRLLSAVAGSDEVCACDLLEPSGRSQPTVSHHMKILVDAGLVQREKRGQWVWYRVVPERLAALRAVLG